MQELLKIACLQVDVQWENPIENIKYYAESIEKTSSHVNLVILPEMFSTGFSLVVSILFALLTPAKDHNNNSKRRNQR